MNNREHHRRYGNAVLAQFDSLPVLADLDLCEIENMGEGGYHKRSHIEQDSDYVPFEQIVLAPDMARFSLRGRS
jgi:hypothetical protein